MSTEANKLKFRFPVRIDGLFALPGAGHGIAKNEAELLALLSEALRLSPTAEAHILEVAME